MGLWDQNHYVIKQKVLTIGRKYYIYDSQDHLIGFCQQKMFKLKEDIRIYTDDTKTVELLMIQQRNILDFTGTFAVTDTLQGGGLVGYVGRKALISIVKDTWKIFDPGNREISTVAEKSNALAILRRLFSLAALIPKTYVFSNNTGVLCEAKQKFQIIGDTWNVLVYHPGQVDIRLILSAALMMDIIEQQQGR